MFLLGMLIGLVFGGCFGVFIMALFQINRLNKKD